MKQCPRCIRPTEETTWMGVTLNGCRLCGGFWFPGGRLTLLARNVPQTLADLDAQWPRTRLTPPSSWGTLWCPECSFVELTPVNLLTEAESQPAGCPKCQGLWLDDEMLTTVQQQLATGWQVPADGLGTLIVEKDEVPDPLEPVPVPESPPEVGPALSDAEFTGASALLPPPPEEAADGVLLLEEEPSQFRSVEAEFSPAPPTDPLEGALGSAPSPPAPGVIVPPTVCVECGTTLLSGARTCLACGTPTSPEHAALAPAPAREVLLAAWPLCRGAVQPLRPENWRTVLRGALIGAGTGAFLGLLTLAIPGFLGNLLGLLLLYAGAAAAPAFVLFPEKMARRSPEAHRHLLAAGLTGLVVGLPLGVFFAPFMRPLLRGAITGAALVLLVEHGMAVYKGCLRNLGWRVRGTVQLLLRGIQRWFGSVEQG